jgi:hypothetical protein
LPINIINQEEVFQGFMFESWPLLSMWLVFCCLVIKFSTLKWILCHQSFVSTFNTCLWNRCQSNYGIVGVVEQVGQLSKEHFRTVFDSFHDIVKKECDKSLEQSIKYCNNNNKSSIVQIDEQYSRPQRWSMDLRHM